MSKCNRHRARQIKKGGGKRACSIHELGFELLTEELKTGSFAGLSQGIV